MWTLSIVEVGDCLPLSVFSLFKCRVKSVNLQPSYKQMEKGFRLVPY